MVSSDIWLDSDTYHILALKSCLEKIPALRLDSLETGRDFELELVPPPTTAALQHEKILG